MLNSCKMLQKQSDAFHAFLWTFFPSLKHNFIAYRSSKVFSRPDYIFEIHQLWQSGFSRVYSNCCCSCSFEREIVKIGKSSHKMYSNNIVNFQESTTILNSCIKKSLETYWRYHVIALLSFELAYYDVAVQHISHYATGTFLVCPYKTFCDSAFPNNLRTGQDKPKEISAKFGLASFIVPYLMSKPSL